MSGDLLDPGSLAEFYLVIRPDGTCRMADSKLDVYDERVGLIWMAAVHELTNWAARYGAHIGMVVGDGGPEYVKLKARLYELVEENATLRAKETA